MTSVPEIIKEIKEYLRKIDGEIYVLLNLMDELELVDGELHALLNLLEDLEVILENHSTKNRCCDQKAKKEGQKRKRESPEG